ncbi:MAG: DMT family transporter [Halocynthiibacter sp.]
MTPLMTAKTVLAMFLWAVCFPLITAGIVYAPHLSFATLRAVLAGLVLTGLAFALRRPLPRGLRNWVALSIVGLGATSLGFLGMFHAAEYVSPGIATVIANTQPLLAAGLAGAVLGERLTRTGKFGLFLGFSGIVVIASPQFFADGQDNYILGVAYIILAAVGITVSNVMIKKISGRFDAIMAMGLQLLIGSVPLAVAAGFTEDPSTIEWTFTFIWVLLALSLFGSALVYWLWVSILQEVALNRANAFSFLVPVFGLAMGALIYGESLGLQDLIGIVLAIVGVGLVTRKGSMPPSESMLPATRM